MIQVCVACFRVGGMPPPVVMLKHDVTGLEARCGGGVTGSIASGVGATRT